MFHIFNFFVSYMVVSSILKILLWEFLNPFLLKIRRKKRIEIKDGIRGINLGCGFDNPENWLGLDGGASLWLIKKSPKFLLRRFFKNFNMSESIEFDEYVQKVRSVKFVYYDIRFGLPFKDSSVPNVFSSHFIEHLTRKDTQKLLGECFRVMKAKGIIRIVVPSLDEQVESITRALEEYNKGRIEPIQEYVTRKESGYLDSFSGHKWMYNFKEMSEMLAEAGFSDIREYDFKTGRIPDVEKLDCREGLIVEAIK